MADPLANRGPGLRRRTLLMLMLAAGLVPAAARADVTPGGRILARRIPATGEAVPAVGLGTSDEFETGSGEGLEPLREVLRLFISLGGTVVDTAPGYGNAEEVIGRLIGELDIGERLFLATKVRAHGREAGLEQMERSERLLGRRPLDLLQVHSLVDVDTQLENLRRWQEAGRVRYIGVTHSRVRPSRRSSACCERKASTSCSSTIRSPSPRPSGDCCRSRPTGAWR